MLEISNQKVDSSEIEGKVYSLKVIHTHKFGKRLAYSLLAILFISFICMFLPWQQNIEGTGSVTALTPQDRPQDVQTAIAGKIKQWNVREGQFIREGDTLVVLSEIKTDYFDPELLKRTREQLQAKRQGIQASKNKINATEKLIAARQTGLDLSLQKARNKYQQAVYKVSIDSADYEAQKVKLQIAERQFSSYEEMFTASAEGDIPLISQTEFEKRKQKLQEMKATLVEKRNKLLVARNEVLNARIQLSSLEAEYLDKIAKAQSDLGSSMSGLADKKAEFSKLRNKYSNLDIRTNQYYVLAPQDGYVVKAKKSGIGETLKENETILTIQPSEPEVAVELYVRAMDVSLISKGRHVRLEFDGWPALQFSGWPSVATGTFGGTVKVIDFVDSSNGTYRILVTPDPNEPWPEALRVGSGVYGWVMLDDVPVWYEIWRQLNGFPPSLYENPNLEDDEDKEDKEDKEKKESGKKIKLKVK